MFDSVVAGTDGSGRAERALEQAIDLARSEGARLHIVTAYPDSKPLRTTISSSARADTVDLRRTAEHVLARAAKRAAERGVEATYEEREGDPADVILDAAAEQGADLIVIGNKGMTGARRYVLGSVPNKVSHHAPCSVMIVHTD